MTWSFIKTFVFWFRLLDCFLMLDHSCFVVFVFTSCLRKERSRLRFFVPGIAIRGIQVKLVMCVRVGH